MIFNPDLPVNLFQHQREGVQFLLANPRALLADEVGLGKTGTALGLIGELLTQEAGPRSGSFAVWLTPPHLIQQTVAEAERFLPRAVVKVGFQHVTNPVVDVAVVSLAQAYKLTEATPRLLVIDEASGVKTGPLPGRSATKAWKCVFALSARSDRVLAMTATPLETSPMETFSILRAIGAPGLPSPRVFNDLLDWKPGYVDPYTRQEVLSVPLGFKTECADAGSAILNASTLRRTASEVGLVLPTRVGETVRWVPIGAGQRAAYESAGRGTGLSGFHRKQAAGRAVGGESALVDAAVAEITSRTEKIVVYARNLDVLDITGRASTAAGASWVRIDGSMSDRARAKALAAFRDPAGPQVLLGSSVLDTGLNLQHCRVLFTLDSEYNPATERQREGRICRIGSPHDTYEHLTFLPDTAQVREKVATLRARSNMAQSSGFGSAA